MQPKIYSIDEHRLPHEKIDSQAYYVIMKLRKNGHKAYLVGGSVRDLLLNVRPKDFDISTSATPEEVKKCFRNCILIGRRFRLAHVRFGKKIIEVATFRSGENENKDLILRDNIWGTEEEDVLRRDFTINGLFYDPENHTIIDYVNGYEDIERKIIRTIGTPSVRFKQDPVRMIRLLKFYARFGFTIDSKTYDAHIACKEEIMKSSAARIFEELLRMLESGHAEPFFRHLQEQGFLQLLIPNLSKYLSSSQDTFYVFLKTIDNFHMKNHIQKLHRAISLSALVFPMIHERLLNEKKNMHLGQIAQYIQKKLLSIFSPFIHIPKKLSAVMITILTNQYRFTPLQKKNTRIRIPNDPSFPLALDFYKIRAEINLDLLKSYTLWHEAEFKNHQRAKPRTKPRRVRR